MTAVIAPPLVGSVVWSRGITSAQTSGLVSDTLVRDALDIGALEIGALEVGAFLSGPIDFSIFYTIPSVLYCDIFLRISDRELS